MRSLVILLFAACTTSDTVPGDPPGSNPPDVVDGVVDDPTPEVEDDTPPPGWELRGNRTRSGRIAHRDGAPFVWAADPDLGGLHRIDLNAGDVRTWSELGEATRLVIMGDTLAVTLREEGEIALYRPEGGQLVHGPRWSVGTEPFDVVASGEGTLFVSLSVDHAVVELNPLSMTELRRWNTPAEPRWLLDSGDEIIVSHATGPALLRIDKVSGGVTTLTLPTQRRAEDDTCLGSPLVPRVTGELELTAAGVLVVPTLYVDPDLTCVSTSDSTTDPNRGPNGSPDQPGGAYATDSDTSRPGKPGRFNAAVVTVALDDPMAEASAWALAANQASFDTSPPISVVRSYPTSVALDIDPVTGDLIGLYAALEGSEALVYVEIAAATREDVGSFRAAARNAMALHGAVSDLRVDPLEPSSLLGFSWLDGRLSTFDRGEIALVHETTQDFADIGLPFPVIAFTGPQMTVDLPAAPLSDDVREGRRLFHTAVDTSVATLGGGVSCASCHADGRTDGNTWVFDDFPRQTPSLAGPVSTTAPFTWTNDVATVAEEAMLTASLRMGGHGLALEQADQLAAYIDWTRDVISPEPADTDQANLVAAGAEIFTRPEVGCAACHLGSRKTDGRAHAMFGLDAVATPPLVGLAATAPYLHDGRAADLRALVNLLDDGSMGDTSSLGNQEREALVAYLRTL